MMNPDSSSLPSPMELALQNPVILSTLFEYVPVADIHSCRLVSKLWKSTSTSQWRSRARLVLDGNRIGQLQRFLRSDQAESDYKLWSLPFRKSFHLYGDESHVEFFELYGAHLKDVHLRIFQDSNNPDFQRILLELTPNLERLTVVGDWLRWERASPSQEPFTTPSVPFPPQENITTFSVELWNYRMDGYVLDWLRFWLRHFPNIQTLKVNNLEWELDEHFLNLSIVRLMGMMTFIGELRKESGYKRLPITHLEIHNACFQEVRKHTRDLVDSFRTANLPLKTLKLDVGFETEEAVVQEILQMHSSTLQTLHVVRGELNEPLQDFLGNDTPFPNLKHLTLAGAVAHNFNFLRNTPNLEVLRHSITTALPNVLWVARERAIVDGLMIEAPITQNLNIRLEKMKELHGEFTIDSGASLNRLAGWMPNLEICDLPLNKEAFPAVCSSWAGTLRQLTINPCDGGSASEQVDDETLTGIPRGWPKRHGRFLMKDRPPNITNLKLLEVFTDAYHQTKSLSNHSICNGFLHLPRLESITVRVSAEQMKLSSTNQSMLTNKGISLKFMERLDD